MQKAASALVVFCDGRRTAILKRAAAAEQLKKDGNMLAIGTPSEVSAVAETDDTVNTMLFSSQAFLN